MEVTCCSHHSKLNTYAKASRVDPTRTLTLRNSFVMDMRRRFNKVNRQIYEAIVTQDVFALQNPTTYAPGRRAFNFPTTQGKVTSFMDWLKQLQEQEILTVTRMPQLGAAANVAWTDMYVQDSYERGIIRARHEMRTAGMMVPSIETTGGITASMSTPFHMDRVGVLYTRVFSELQNITSAMDNQISKVLAQGLIDGDGPRLLAKKIHGTMHGGMPGLTDSLGRFMPGARRAEILARTEVIRAHHVGMVQEYKNWDVVGVKVLAEWRTAGDGRVCEQCAQLQGVIYTLEKAEGLIPLHPQCRCIVLPTMPEKPEPSVPAPAQEIILPENPYTWKYTNNAEKLREQMENLYGSFSIPESHLQKLNPIEKKQINQIGQTISEIYIRNPKVAELVKQHSIIKKSPSFHIDVHTTGRTVSPARNPGVLATYNSSNNLIKIGRTAMSRPTHDLSLGVKGAPGGAFIVSRDLTGVLTHEFGHHIEKIISDFARIKWNGFFNSRQSLWWASYVSRYAAYSKGEAFAETFGAYMSPLYKQGLLIQELEELIERIIGKRIDL